MRNAAAGGLRRKAPHEARGDRGRRGAAEDNERGAPPAEPVRRRDQHVAQLVRLNEREAEGGADEPGEGAGRKRQQPEREQPALRPRVRIAGVRPLVLDHAPPRP